MDGGGGSYRVEAERWLTIAEKLLIARDLQGAKTFAIRARESDPRLLHFADQIIAIADTLLAAEIRVRDHYGASTDTHDYYALLQLPRLTHSMELIATQYRKLALLLNPNRNRLAYADQAFHLVSDAWMLFSNPSKKAMYDSLLQPVQLGLSAAQFANQGFVVDHVATQMPQSPVSSSSRMMSRDSSVEPVTNQWVPVSTQSTRQPTQEYQFTDTAATVGRSSASTQHFLPQPTKPLAQQKQPPPPPPPQPQPQPQPPQPSRPTPPVWISQSQQPVDRPAALNVAPELSRPAALNVAPELSRPAALNVAPELSRPAAPKVAPEPSRPAAPNVAPESSRPAAPSVAPESSRPVAPSVAPESSRPAAPNVAPESSRPAAPKVAPESSRPSAPKVAAESSRPAATQRSPAKSATPVATRQSTAEAQQQLPTPPQQQSPAPPPQPQVPSFWTACPYCYILYEYPKVYEECALKCQNCKRGFHAVAVPSPPVSSKDTYFCCWGFFPLGYSGGKKFGLGDSNWSPFSAMFSTPLQPGGQMSSSSTATATATTATAAAAGKGSRPKTIYKDDVYIEISDLSSDDDKSDSDDDDWDRTEKKPKRPRGRPPSKNVKKMQVERPRRGCNNNNTVVDGSSSDAVRQQIAAVKGEGSSSGKKMKGGKDLGKLDLNVMFSNEGDEAAPPGATERNGNAHGVEDNIEGISFFEGLDEFLSSLPILSVVGDDKVKAT
ncbi:Ttn [Linum perenne]